MKILIAGSNGLIGSAVTRHLLECGYDVVDWSGINHLNMKSGGNPETSEIDTTGLDGFDGVVHLASIPWPLRWTAMAKQKLRANRLATNHFRLNDWLAVNTNPKCLYVPLEWATTRHQVKQLLQRIVPVVRVFLPGSNRMARQPLLRQVKQESELSTYASLQF